MALDLFSKLSDAKLLKRAWHLARNDSRTDFMLDPYRFSDFGLHLDEYLRGLAQSLASGTYHPRPLLTIDVPKSSLSVRPGSVLEMEDKIVLFAISCLIAPTLDKKLPSNVYSWRVKKDPNQIELFHDHEILEFPFLKGRTIKKRVDFVEPWYVAWPNFVDESKHFYEKEGYNFLVVSDIVAYFENIDLELLRNLLLQELPKQAHLINFLINLLEYWAWPAPQGPVAPRGIPQGNGVSSFLGNIYLLPLDRALVRIAKRLNLKYLRYMDDVKVLAKDMSSAREALFRMNDTLRSLRLNIQGAKTRILQGTELKEELIDSRLNSVNELIREIQGKGQVSTYKRKRYAATLKGHLYKIKGRKGIIRDKELRLFRRLVTAFAGIHDSGMVNPVLDQLERNPDARLLYNAVRYLRLQDRNFKTIAERVFKLLRYEREIFPYQQAHLLIILRYVRHLPPKALSLAKHLVTSRKKVHWYVRQQAAILISSQPLSREMLATFRQIYKDEENLEVKRSWLQAFGQLSAQELKDVVNNLTFSVDQKLQRVGRFYHSLLFDEQEGFAQITSIFNNISDDILFDRMYQLEVLSKADSNKVKRKLLECLRPLRNSVRWPILKDRICRITDRLEGELSEPAPTLFS